MIKYQLICKSCDYKFDSWFASSNEYERLKKKKLISCNICNSSKIDKSIMSPRISSKKVSYSSGNSNKLYEVKSKIKPNHFVSVLVFAFQLARLDITQRTQTRLVSLLNLLRQIFDVLHRDQPKIRNAARAFIVCR